MKKIAVIVLGVFLSSSAFAAMPVLDWLSGNQKDKTQKNQKLEMKHQERGDLNQGAKLTGAVHNPTPLEFITHETQETFNSQY